MKKVYVDISMLLVGTSFTGIPRVVMELTERLYRKPDLQMVFLEYDQKADDFRVIDTEGFVGFCREKEGNRGKLRTKEHISFDDFEKGGVFFDMDTVWKTRVRRSFLYPKLRKQGVRIVPFIQDIIGVTHPQFCPRDDMLCFLDFVGASLLYGDEIVVTSRATKDSIDELCDRLSTDKKVIRIVPLGGDFRQTAPKPAEATEIAEPTGNAESTEAAEKRAGVSERVRSIASKGRYLLMVGTVEPRKNHKLLLDAYDIGLKEMGMNLVIAGYQGWNMEAFFNRLTGHRDYENGIWHVCGATDEEISYLYEHCFALAFPSYIEGYGLPIMEAFVRGVPVLAADTPINREIAGEYGAYFGQDEPESLVKLVKELSDHPAEYDRLKNGLKDFVPPSWEDTAEGIWKILHE